MNCIDALKKNTTLDNNRAKNNNFQKPYCLIYTIHQIELENGDCVTTKGFAKKESNRISNHFYTATNCFYLLPFYFFSRIGNLFFLLGNIFSLIFIFRDFITANEALIIFYIPLFVTFTSFTIRELYFDSLIRHQDSIINNRKVTIFQKIHKHVKPEPIAKSLFLSIKKQSFEDCDDKFKI